MSSNDSKFKDLFAQIEYLAIRKEGASVTVAAAYVSHKWDVSGRCLVEAEQLVSGNGIGTVVLN